eukprot:TRINITY_DN1016_c0_g1_i1.p1 TRINITY_DN1016_c0_g1~~TRINITY_DN1016_c0_g1_i1.p1  ORF type:complete len:201 (-),score=62.62 TRINITY_DN1016_c0_g1_i1:147-719(-)
MSALKNAIQDILLKDHRAIESAFTKLSGTSEPAKRLELTEQLIRMVVVHAMTEETELYPRFSKLLDHGKETQDHSVHEHKDLDVSLRDLEKMDVADPLFSNKVNEAYQKFKTHITEEETVIFPKVQAKMSSTELKDLADRMETVRMMVPTHPHPNAPQAMRESKIGGSLVGMLDRMRDLFTSASKNDMKV